MRKLERESLQMVAGSLIFGHATLPGPGGENFWPMKGAQMFFTKWASDQGTLVEVFPRRKTPLGNLRAFLTGIFNKQEYEEFLQTVFMAPYTIRMDWQGKEVGLCGEEQRF
jgi:hypothetical protein